MKNDKFRFTWSSWRYSLWILVFVVGVCTYFAQARDLTPYKTAPDFVLPRMFGGEDYRLSTEKAPIVVLNFFASWCAPCRAEHDELLQLAKDHNVYMIGIAMRDSAKKLQPYLTNMGSPYKAVLNDRYGRVSVGFGVQGLPETIILDQKRQIRFHHIGPLQRRDLDAKLLPILRELG